MQNALPLVWDGSQTPPSFEQVLEALGPIPGLVFRAIDFGAVKNHTYFDDLCDGEHPRPYIREMVVRDQATRYLKTNGIAVEEDPVTLIKEPLVALVFRYRSMHIRVLKAKEGIVPGCGRSKNRRKFYNQRPTMYREASGQTKRTKWNLLILWDFDAVFNVGKVWLAFPTVGASRSSDVDCAWKKELQHPAKEVRIQPEVPEIAAQEEQELRDLFNDQTDEQDNEESGSAGA